MALAYYRSKLTFLASGNDFIDESNADWDPKGPENYLEKPELFVCGPRTKDVLTSNEFRWWNRFGRPKISSLHPDKIVLPEGQEASWYSKVLCACCIPIFS